MATVEMTQHLYRFFPALREQKIVVPTGSVADVLRAVDAIAPGFASHIVDEFGGVNRHIETILESMQCREFRQDVSK